MSTYLPLLWVGLGSALGGALRFLVTVLVTNWAGPGFPVATLLINIVGCVFLGFFFSATNDIGGRPVSLEMRQFVMPGFCGGFTTFSTFSLESLNLVRDGALAKAGTYIGLSMTLCLFGVWVGYLAGKALQR